VITIASILVYVVACALAISGDYPDAFAVLMVMFWNTFVRR
jgi:hypothetical protein